MMMQAANFFALHEYAPGEKSMPNIKKVHTEHFVLYGQITFL